MRSRLKLVVPLALVAAFGAWKFVLARPAPAQKPKVAGQVYVLQKDFLVNLSDGRFAKVAVGLVLSEAQSLGGAEGEGAPAPPEGFGPLEQEAVVRDIVTDQLTNQSAETLGSRRGRDRLKEEILRAIRKRTDVKAEEVLLMDVTVQ